MAGGIVARGFAGAILFAVPRRSISRISAPPAVVATVAPAAAGVWDDTVNGVVDGVGNTVNGLLGQ
ncbi:MAG TPA: hypothetical protein VF052_08230 [Solirubrobacterales bacterium]